MNEYHAELELELEAEPTHFPNVAIPSQIRFHTNNPNASLTPSASMIPPAMKVERQHKIPDSRQSMALVTPLNPLLICALHEITDDLTVSRYFPDPSFSSPDLLLVNPYTVLCYARFVFLSVFPSEDTGSSGPT
jgi:hypothetical protein